MSSNRSRVLIADDHNLVAELCKGLLDPEFDVVGVVCNGYDLVRAAEELKPDVIALDIAMPVLNGLDAGKQVKEALHSVKLVYLTMNTDPELANLQPSIPSEPNSSSKGRRRMACFYFALAG